MIRVHRGRVAQDRRASILDAARGFRGSHSRLYRMANQQVVRARVYAYTGRKRRKRDFKKLWMSRIAGYLHYMKVEHQLNAIVRGEGPTNGYTFKDCKADRGDPTDSFTAPGHDFVPLDFIYPEWADWSFGDFMHRLAEKKVALNSKMVAELMLLDPKFPLNLLQAIEDKPKGTGHPDHESS